MRPGAGTGVVALTIGALRAALTSAGETSQSIIITTDLGMQSLVSRLHLVSMDVQ